MRKLILPAMGAILLATTFGSGVAAADSPNSANGCNALGQERSSWAGLGGWGNGGEYPGIAYDARFGGTEIYGQYIKAFITDRCSD